MMDPLYYIFNNLKDENEINIIKKYHRIAKCYTIVFMGKTIFIDFRQ